MCATEIRGDLSARLKARQPDIEQAILARVYAVADPGEFDDPVYVEGLRASISAALDFGLEAIERSEDNPPAIPIALLSQARLAARLGVRLDTVLRRYFCGYTLLGDFVIEEAEKGKLARGVALKRLLRAQAALFDRLIVVISEEYGREANARHESMDERKARQVSRLLAGELINGLELGYELDGYHLGLVAVGPHAEERIRSLGRALDLRLLLAGERDTTLWAWLGSHREVSAGELEQAAAEGWPAGCSVALGESGHGALGWRLTHRQAKAALPIALRTGSPVVRYADVALLASALRDDLLATSLHQLYLAPLDRAGGNGQVLRETLRAYFATGHNVSSAASRLKVSRQTMTSRLRLIEERLGQPVDRCASAMNVALECERANGGERDKLCSPSTG